MKTEWRCIRCLSKNGADDNVCQNCGLWKSKTIYGEILESYLLQRTKDGTLNIDVIRRYAYGYTKTKNMPFYLAEDAIANAMMRLVMHIKEYDPKQSSFLTWAIAIVKNELRSAARKDARKNKLFALSLDEETEDGALLAEVVEGDNLSVDDLIALEEVERYRFMAKIARSELGTYTTAEGEEREVLDACLESYIRNDGSQWMSDAGRRSGVGKFKIFRAIERIRRIWNKWEA